MDGTWSKTPREVLQALATNTTHGLAASEAVNRLRQYGPNEMKEVEKTAWITLIIKQFDDLLVKILLGAAVLSLGLGLLEENASLGEAMIEPTVIMAILIANAIVGVWQESSAENSIEKLKEYESSDAVVLRDGERRVVSRKDLVPGDIVFLEAGAKVPADCRMVTIRSFTLRCDQSVMTGENLAVMKQIEKIESTSKLVDQDKKNIVFAGTTVVQGSGQAIVVQTGESTVLGGIQKSLSEQEEVKTPLGQKLDEFAEQLSKVITVICVIVWLINIGHFSDPERGGWIQGAIYYFKIAIALAVAAIPEGLPAVVTTCLALGTYRMAKKNAIVRSLPSVETLGCCSVICSDKTGTLTTNKMLACNAAMLDAAARTISYTIEGDGFKPQGVVNKTDPGRTSGGQDGGSSPITASQDQGLGLLARIATVCNEAALQYTKNKWSLVVGGPTEGALKVLAEKLGSPDETYNTHHKNLPPPQFGFAVHKYWEERFEKTHLFEFSRDRKRMSVVTTDRNSGAQQLLCKGAPESVLDCCTKAYLDGSIVQMTGAIRKTILDSLEVLQSKGLRCLAMAMKDQPTKITRADITGSGNITATFASFEKNLTYVGVVGMLDPPRPEVRGSIEKCNRAGIRVIVITGDNQVTAEAICRRIGVFSSDEKLEGKSFRGVDFMAMDAGQREEVVKNASLFSRVEPAHKKELVMLLQKQGEVVAMTGDGVNDAPALARADIGVGMGSGTDVAKEASDMILQDDNFSTIVAAVEEGRAIYANTKQFIRYLISSNIGEVAVIFFIAALGLPEALIPVQLLWVNLVTDGLPATALGFNQADPDIMETPPRARTEKIIDGWMFFRYFFIGIYIGVGTCIGFIWWWCYYTEGPMMSYQQLVNHHACGGTSEFATSIFPSDFDCDVFHQYNASTVALSVLVTIEMFNTFNALSENQSLLVQTPLTNIWVVLAVALSMSLHCLILYNDFLVSIFSTAPLNQAEWTCVIGISFPVIIFDEILKFFSRRLTGTSHSGLGSKTKVQ